MSYLNENSSKNRIFSFDNYQNFQIVKNFDLSFVDVDSYRFVAADQMIVVAVEFGLG